MPQTDAQKKAAARKRKATNNELSEKLTRAQKDNIRLRAELKAMKYWADKTRGQ